MSGQLSILQCRRPTIAIPPRRIRRKSAPRNSNRCAPRWRRCRIGRLFRCDWRLSDRYVPRPGLHCGAGAGRPSAASCGSMRLASAAPADAAMRLNARSKRARLDAEFALAARRFISACLHYRQPRLTPVPAEPSFYRLLHAIGRLLTHMHRSRAFALPVERRPARRPVGHQALVQQSTPFISSFGVTGTAMPPRLLRAILPGHPEARYASDSQVPALDPRP